MIYRNTKTGVILDSPCDISGGDWVSEDDIPAIENDPKKNDDDTTDAEPEEIDYEGMTIAELKDFAELHKINLGDAKKKDEIVAVLTSAT